MCALLVICLQGKLNSTFAATVNVAANATNINRAKERALNLQNMNLIRFCTINCKKNPHTGKNNGII